MMILARCTCGWSRWYMLMMILTYCSCCWSRWYRLWWYWHVARAVGPIVLMPLWWSCSALGSAVIDVVTGQRLVSVCVTHHFFSLLPTLRIGVQPKYKHLNKTLLFFDYKSNSRYKDQYCMPDVTFIRSVPALHAEKSIPTLFSPVSRSLRKVTYTWPSILTFVKLTWICKWAF